MPSSDDLNYDVIFLSIRRRAQRYLFIERDGTEMGSLQKCEQLGLIIKHRVCQTGLSRRL